MLRPGNVHSASMALAPSCFRPSRPGMSGRVFAVTSEPMPPLRARRSIKLEASQLPLRHPPIPSDDVVQREIDFLGLTSSPRSVRPPKRPIIFYYDFRFISIWKLGPFPCVRSLATVEWHCRRTLPSRSDSLSRTIIGSTRGATCYFYTPAEAQAGATGSS